MGIVRAPTRFILIWEDTHMSSAPGYESALLVAPTVFCKNKLFCMDNAADVTVAVLVSFVKWLFR